MPPSDRDARHSALQGALFDLSEMAPASRERWLRHCRAEMPTLHAALRPHLPHLPGLPTAGDHTSPPRLATHGDADPTPTDTDPADTTLHAGVTLHPGARLGPWQLDAEIGRGGMGVVWRAHRADGRFDREVAVKLLPPLFADATLRTRFDRETQAQARLSHPHIAQLLDAGRTDDGTAWLVMELVDGEPLMAHVRRRQLPLRARLALMLQLADAVAHAHRHLLVHRDLKPGNVLVDLRGHVKLLDFGVAKLLDEAGGEPLTREGGAFTPGYASPEQVQGQTVTTLSDVFSLGVMLHELLTGQGPFLQPGDTLGAVMQRTLQLEVSAPSRHPQTLPGVDADLDAIALRALAKAPDERLPGADALAADLRAWLDGRPVSARAPGWAERSWKLVRRHRLVSAISVLGLAGTLGFAGDAWQSARHARAQQQLAEQRLQQVRQFARQVIHDYNGLLEAVPGTIQVRERLVGDALGYLDAEAASAAGDPGFQRELADAYLAIGNVQGRGLAGPGLGHFDAAQASFEHSARLYQPRCADAQAPAAERADHCLGWARTQEAQAQLLAVQGQRDAAIERLSRVLDELDRWPAETLPESQRPVHRGLQRATLGTLASLESHAHGERWTQALQHARLHWEQLRAEATAADAPAASRMQAGFAGDLLAFLLVAHGRADEGLTIITPLVAQARALARTPDRRDLRILLATASQTEGELRLLAGQASAGTALLRESTALAADLLQQEPGNPQARHGYLMSAWRLARGLRRTGQHAQALQAARQGLAAAPRLADLPPFLRGQRLRLETELALALGALGRRAEARTAAERARTGLTGLAAAGGPPSRQVLDLATAEAAWLLNSPPGHGGERRTAWQRAHGHLQAWLQLTPADLEAQAQMARLCALALADIELMADPALAAQARQSRQHAAAALQPLWPDSDTLPGIWRLPAL